VASLTKPLITAFLSVLLAERRQLDLDQPIQRALPLIGLPVTARQLLCHTAGLPPWYPFYLYQAQGFPADELLRRPQPLARPGQKAIYSCVGYMLLRRLLEQVSGTDFVGLARQLIFEPLHLGRTFLIVPPERRSQAAATERGNLYERRLALKWDRRRAAAFAWRRELICGEAHDVNSFTSGGTAGNAGLFSCAADLFRLALEFFPSTATLLRAESIRLFWTPATPGNRGRRTIGFKRNDSRLASGGRALVPEAIGHTGFTGTSIWLEPGSEDKFIILSNRIHPRVPSAGFNPLRRRLHVLLKQELDA
jgi:CubicO group peptidase (beta-lactamase class C family)